MDDLAVLPAWRLRELMHERAVSPVEVMEATLRRCEALQAAYRPMVTVDAERALAEARASEDRILRGIELGPLEGVPVSVKDALWTEGMRTTCGSLLFDDFVPTRDSTPARRLREAGAIIFGKTNLPEFSMYRRTVNLVVGETVNAWDPMCSAGGSSGGAAVSAALGIGPIAIGSDGGGSIRVPASFNGVFGLLPSRGRVPQGPGFYSEPLFGIGPLSRDVRDAALVLQVLAGHDPEDAVSLATAPPDYVGALNDGVKGLRVAWSADFGRVVPHRPEVLDVVHRTARILGELGARFEEPHLHIEDPHDALSLDQRHTFDRAMAPYRAVPGFYGLDEFLAEVRADPDRWRRLAIYIREQGEPPTQYEYTKAIAPAVRHRPTDHLEQVFEQYDLLLSPTISRPAPLATDAGVVTWNYCEYTRVVNMSGYAAASVPAGFVDGLPVGLQVMGRPDDEATVLRACRALELAHPWAQHRPPLEGGARADD